MCPACLATTAAVIAGITTAGGLTAVLAKARGRGGRGGRTPAASTTTPSAREGDAMALRTVVSRDQWVSARKALLEKEKALTRAQDALAAERRALPMVKVDTTYLFDTPQGPRSLAELFDGRSQLVVYHFMFGPGWAEGCPSCSLLADHIDGSLVHLAHRDVTLLAVSRAPLPQIQAFRQRMGWKFPWVSSFGSTFNRDFHVSFSKEDVARGQGYYNFAEQGFPSEEAPGVSVFYKDALGDVYHTYSSYARGGERLIGVYQYLDLVPKGRDEDGLAFSMAWVRHHDRYTDDYRVDRAKAYEPPPIAAPCCTEATTTE